MTDIPNKISAMSLLGNSPWGPFLLAISHNKARVCGEVRRRGLYAHAQWNLVRAGLVHFFVCSFVESDSSNMD